MKSLSVKIVIGILMVVALAITMIRPAAQARAAPAGPDAVIAWNSIMLQAVVVDGKQPPPASFVYGTYVQTAVYNAVVAIEGGYEPYYSSIPSSPGASVDAAVATAAHDVLVHYFPAQQTTLDTRYQEFLATIPDGSAKNAGIGVGSQAAIELTKLREDDVRSGGFTMPAPGPGVWQLPPTANPTTPWLATLKPFMLESPDQFVVGPPPDLSSSEWATEYNEVMLYGRKDSQVRTPEQTEIASFWGAPPLSQYNLAYQDIAKSEPLNALETARLMAMGNMVGTDALISCFNSKYHYLFWRPVTAITQGDTDGNPDTVADPTFTPLLPTPAHPEYPSAHGCETFAQAEVFSEFLGTQHIRVTIPSAVPNVKGHYFETANDLTKEIVNARVWAGIHYRESVIKGGNLGRKVAQWTLKQYFLPTN